MNVFIPDKKLFVSSFLSPLSKINDSCVITVSEEGFSAIVSTSDSSVILSSQYKVELDIDKPMDLNIADLKKVLKAFDCIGSNSFTLNIDTNNICYNGTEIRFKYHLLEDGIITKPKINLQKLGSLEFPVIFPIQYKSLLELLRGSTFATESNKLYIYTENNKVFGDLTDKARHNVDSMSIPLSEYHGTSFPGLCLNFEIIRIISGVKVKQLECKINPKLGVVLFQATDNIVHTQYIASTLVK